MILNASDCYFNIFQPMHSNIFQPCPTCTSAYQSDEGCRTDLFKRSQRKGVGYLLIIIAFSNHTHVCIEITTTSTMQRRLGKYGTHVHVATKLSNVSIQQTCLEKSSVDAHAVSSYLGCSRILRHLISFLNIITGLPTWKKTCTRNIQPHLITKPVKTVHRIREGQHHDTPCYTNAVLLLVQFKCCSER